MAKKETKAMSVITVPLKTEKWQEDIIDKRLELCRKIYNSMLRHRMKLYNIMAEKEEWVNATKIINDAYKSSDKAKRKTDEFKAAAEVKKEFLRNFGFSEFDFISEALEFRKVYSQNVSSTVASMTIASPMWVAFEKVFFDKGKKVHFKKYGDITTVVSDGKSGIRIIDKNGKTVKKPDGNTDLYCVFSSQGGKAIIMPLVIDHNDVYLLEMLDRNIKVVRIKREQIHGKNRYFVQLTVEGVPAVKYDETTGEIMHPINEGRVGIYIDTRYCTVATESGITQYDLSEGVILHTEERAELERFMDTSKRISNPENFNENGTIKNGIMVEDRRTKLKWTFSNNYEKARCRRSDLYRREAAGKKIKRNEMANFILTLGNDIVVNDYPFQVAAMREKFAEGEENMASGLPKKKKKAGKAVGENAPAAFVTALDQKLKAAGYAGVTKVKLSDVDYEADGYRQFYAEQLRIS